MVVFGLDQHALHSRRVGEEQFDLLSEVACPLPLEGVGVVELSLLGTRQISLHHRHHLGWAASSICAWWMRLSRQLLVANRNHATNLGERSNSTTDR